MNYNVFDIEIRLNNIEKQLKGTNFIQDTYNDINKLHNSEYRIILENEVKDIHKKVSLCKDIFKVQNVINPRFQMDLDATVLILQLLTEIEKYITKNVPEIITNKFAELAKKEQYYEFQYMNNNIVFISIIRSMVVYFFNIHKEIFYLSNQSLHIGVFARFRVLIEIYSIIKFFIEHQECVIRFFDHQIIRNHIINKKWNQINDNIELYNFVKNKYKNEFNTFKMNYGWAGKYITRHNSIKEIMDIAFKDKYEKEHFKKEYDLLSEYSHVSSYTINTIGNISKGNLSLILARSNELSIYLTEVYLKIILTNTKYKEEPIAYILPLLNIFYYITIKN